jgi:hypothetical protein
MKRNVSLTVTTLDFGRSTRVELLSMWDLVAGRGGRAVLD